MKLKLLLIFSIVVTASLILVAQQSKAPAGQKAMVTFIELGSVRCIPCKKMQPVMKAIEAKYTGKVSVVFYDVWQDDQKKYADTYGVKIIPTQIFLDAKGMEFFRHEGYLPEKEIHALLAGRGIMQSNKK